MLEKIEEARIKAVNKRRIVIVAVIIIGIVLWVLFGRIIIEVPQLIIFYVIIAILLISLIPAKEIKAFNDLYKTHIVSAAFKEIFEDVTFDVNNGIDYSTLSKTGMIDMGDSFTSNDYVSGRYKNIKFESSDVKITETHEDSEGHSYTVTLFSGQWYIFDFNKTFKANVQVKTKNFSSARRYRKSNESKYEKVEMEDVEFNKLFTCYAQAPIDAFYIMTPNMMERLKNIKNAMRHDLLFCFIDNKLHVGVYSGSDLYEPSINKPVNLELARQTALKEIKPVTDFIDGLNLDNDLFKRM